MSESWFDQLRLACCLKLLHFYVIPKSKLQSLLDQWLGLPQPTLEHRLANATISWLSSRLSVPHFRALTTASQNPATLIEDCPTLLKHDAVCELINADHLQTLPGSRSSRQFDAIPFDAWYTPKVPLSSHIIFYVHGGGFVSGSPETASPYLLQLAVELESRGILVDIFAMRYGLAPETPYPHALRQVVAAYNYIQSLGKPIIVVGDSAGGNLCLGLLRHIKIPHPQIPALPASNKTRGYTIATYLASPWVNLHNDGDSYRSNAGRDCLDKAALDRWRQAYLVKQNVDLYSNPIDAVKGWSTVLPPKTILVSGELDLFVADILQLARQMNNDNEMGVDVHVAPSKGHVWSMVDFGGTPPGTPSSYVEESKQSAYAGLVLQADWIANVCAV